MPAVRLAAVFLVMLICSPGNVFATETPCDACAPAADAAAYKASLLLALKNRSYVATFANQARAQGKPAAKLLHKVLAGDVIVVPVEDLPQITRFISVGDGKRFGLTDQAIFDAALSNLKARVEKVELRDMDRIRALSFEADYNTSLALLSHVWASVPDLPASLVVAMPARDILAFGDGADPDAVAALRRIAQMSSDGYPVTKQLLKRVGERWSVLE